MKNVPSLTDGSCIANPGPDGWARILRCGNEERGLSGSEAHTTNNGMEFAAAIHGRKALREACEVERVTDSPYLNEGLTRYLKRWKVIGWRTSGWKLVHNQDLCTS